MCHLGVIKPPETVLFKNREHDDAYVTFKKGIFVSFAVINIEYL